MTTFKEIIEIVDWIGRFTAVLFVYTTITQIIKQRTNITKFATSNQLFTEILILLLFILSPFSILLTTYYFHTHSIPYSTSQQILMIVNAIGFIYSIYLGQK